MVANNLNQQVLMLAKNIAHKVWQQAALSPQEIERRQQYNQSIPTDLLSNIDLLYGQFSTIRDKEYFLELASRSKDKQAEKLVKWVLNYQQQSSIF